MGVCDYVCFSNRWYTHITSSGVLRPVPQVLTAEQQRAFCRIGAIIRGFLTRRLLKTEKVKHLRQTILVRRCDKNVYTQPKTLDEV